MDAFDARTKNQLIRVPVGTALWRQYRKSHAAEPADKERRGELDGKMMRFVPGHIGFAVVRVQFSKSDERVCFMNVAAYGVSHQRHRPHVRVRDDLK